MVGSRRRRRIIRVPPEIGRARARLVAAHIVGPHVSEDEILRRYRLAGEPPQHRELAGVRHGVGQRALEKLFIRDPCRQRRIGESVAQLREHRVEARHFGVEAVELWRCVRISTEHRPGVADHARHVPEELPRRADVRQRAIVRETLGRVAQCLLRAIRKRRQATRPSRCFQLYTPAVALRSPTTA